MTHHRHNMMENNYIIAKLCIEVITSIKLVNFLTPDMATESKEADKLRTYNHLLNFDFKPLTFRTRAVNTSGPCSIPTRNQGQSW